MKSYVEVCSEWIEANIVVPTGPLAGEPFRLAPWQQTVLDAVINPQIKEVGLSVARKNGKSAFCAAIVLLYLCGPLKKRYWSGIAGATDGQRARDLFNQIVQMIESSPVLSELLSSNYRSAMDFEAEQLAVRMTGFGSIRGFLGSELVFSAATKTAGLAGGYDLCIIDEYGALEEPHRQYVTSLTTSTAGRGGKALLIGTQYLGPFFPELMERASRMRHYSKCFMYEAPEGCDLLDENAWREANPAFEHGLLDKELLKFDAEKAVATPTEEADFRAHRLNQRIDPSMVNVVPYDAWKSCLVSTLPPRDGPLFVGLDLGESSSMSACALYWPETARLETYGAFAPMPGVAKRGLQDRVGNLYQRAFDRGQLIVIGGPRELTVDPAAFVNHVLEWLGDAEPEVVSADAYKMSFIKDAMMRNGTIHWRINFERGGRGVTGFESLTLFQTAVADRKVLVDEKELLLTMGISDSVLKSDNQGNSYLDKQHTVSRIDALSAAILAVAEGQRWMMTQVASLPLFSI